MTLKNRTFPLLAAILLSCLPVLGLQSPDTADMLAYIDKSWDVLTRSMDNCQTVADKRDPKQSVLYLPAGFREPDAVRELAAKCNISVQSLPERISAPGTFNPRTLKQQGVLYLQHPYVVPGGFFNEMYGWDSYFILRGLLRAGRLELARGIVQNFFFEIDHYGTILNANRTYFLTRSQPPFLSSMVAAVRDADIDPQRRKAFLQEAYPYIERDYKMWTSGEHLAGDTGLSRYFDYGSGPSPELVDHPYYRDVFRYLQAVPDNHEYLRPANDSSATLMGPEYTLQICEQGPETEKKCETSEPYRFTADYYKGDRAMRESGFDISFRFGAFSGSTHHYAPVCLNSLLYKTETDMESISRELGMAAEAKQWGERAQQRKVRMNRYLWDAHRGMFMDYDFTKHELSTYEYITTFYPLWAGVATPAQAKAVVSNLKAFEHDGGMAMSPYRTGVQWDLPYGWAPTQLIAVEGMRRSGFSSDADRVAQKWIQTVLTNFRRDGTIREKYDVVSQSTEAPVTAGYKTNVVGFGWTNGVVLEFASELGMTGRKAQSAALH